MPSVYIPQLPSRFDTASHLWIPTINVAPAERYGSLKIMLPPGANRLPMKALVDSLQASMEGYGPDDFLVAVGDPSILAAAACIAHRASGGTLRLLKWDRVQSDYQLTEIQL